MEMKSNGSRGRPDDSGICFDAGRERRLASMWHHWRVFRVELQRRRWPRLVKNVWLVFAFFGGSMLVLHYALKYFFSNALVGAWIISVLLSMVGLLLLML